MPRRAPNGDPSRLSLWRRSLIFGAVGLLALAATPFAGSWLILTLPLAALLLFMAYWVSPLRTGPHTPWLTALASRAPDHAIIIWSTVDPGSAQIQVGLTAQDSRLTWVNYMHDTEAWAFARQHGGFEALPLAVVGEQIIPNATAGAIVNALAATR